MVLILLLDYVDLAHPMDFWLVCLQALSVLIKPEERRKYCFSNADKDASASLTDVFATGNVAAAILSLTTPSLLSPGGAEVHRYYHTPWYQLVRAE